MNSVFRYVQEKLSLSHQFNVCSEKKLLSAVSCNYSFYKVTSYELPNKIHFSLVLNFRDIYKCFMFQFGARKIPT